MKATTKTISPETKNNATAKSSVSEIFQLHNYKLILVGVGIIFLGYLLMIGGKSENPGVFLTDEIYSFRRITLAPIVIVAGFGVVVYGILKGNKKDA